MAVWWGTMQTWWGTGPPRPHRSYATVSVTDADAMDTIDSEPAVTLDNMLVLATNINPSVNPSLLPRATNHPTGTLLGSSIK